MTREPPPRRAFLIAEVGVNHNGDPKLAHELVDVSAAAGADAVKFQSFRAETLVTADAPRAKYQAARVGAGTQLDMLRSLELDDGVHLELRDHCLEAGVEFLSTPFDSERLRFLVDTVGVRRLKLGSSEVTNGPLLLEAARSGLPVILSTGMSDLAEIREALSVLAYGYINPSPPDSQSSARAALDDAAAAALVQQRVTLLQCTTDYPTPPPSMNLSVMATLAAEFGTAVGLSDHSDGTAMGLAAVALGASVLEKHITLDRSMKGPDHAASLQPEELRSLFAAAREIEQGIGTGIKEPTSAELDNRVAARRSIVAARPIASGATLCAEDLATLRPGTGITPMRWWDLVGRRTSRAYSVGEQLDE